MKRPLEIAHRLLDLRAIARPLHVGRHVHAPERLLDERLERRRVLQRPIDRLLLIGARAGTRAFERRVAPDRSTTSDDHSLAVLLFYMFCRGNPTATT